MNESDKWEGLQQGTGRENEINVDPYMSAAGIFTQRRK